MLIFNGTDAIYVPSPASPASVRERLVEHRNYASNYPFVDLFWYDGNDGKKIECHLGYITSEGFPRDEDKIQIGHIIVNKIEVAAEKHDEWLCFDDEYYIDYQYIFYITIDNRKELFSSPKDRIIYQKGKIKSQNNNSIISFFTDLVPLINDDLEKGIPTQELNVDYYKQKYFDGGKVYKDYENSPYRISLDDTLDIIYSIQIKYGDSRFIEYQLGEGERYVSFEGKEGVLYNLYISKLIGRIIDSYLKKSTGENGVIYSGCLQKMPLYLKYDLESLRRYLLRKLYVGVLLNYEQDKAEDGFRFANSITEYKDIQQDDKICSLLNFLLGMRATRFEDGVYRVGRDDIGWEEYTVLFPTEYGFQPSSNLLQLINDTLGITLEKQVDNLCYYCQHIENRDYIAGMASRNDIGSYDLQRNYLHRLMKTIIPLLTNKEQRAALFR